MTYREIIDGILDIIGYEDDKTEFVEKFMTKANLEALFDLAESLPPDQQTKLDAELTNAANQSSPAHDLLKPYFTPEQVSQASDKAVIRALAGLIETVSESLTKDEMQQIADLLEKADSQSVPAN